MSKEELLKYLIAEIDLIIHDKDYRFENANGTWYSRESCRDLTNEEVFEELRTELRQFADLEAKLAEAQKTIEIQKISNNALQEENLDYHYDITDTAYEQAKYMAESWEEDYQQEITELKQQLHDLPNKIMEEIKDCLLDFSNGWWRHFMTDGCEYMLSSDLQGCLDETIDTILKKFGG